ncbi:MAG TPA: hypothetical protein QF753_17325 [Victivallales bacterium]|nr:hypothetical protein [Victivallales bacterium]
MNFNNHLAKFIIIASFTLVLPLYAAQEYIGKVVPIVDEALSTSTGAYSRGWVDYTARFGSIITGTVYNSDGKIIIPGTILIDGKSKTWEPYVQADIIQLAAAKKIKNLSYDDYKRDKWLSQKAAISKQQFINAKSNLEAAIGNYENDITNLEEGKISVSLLTTRAVFEGMVTSITQASGSDVNGAPVVSVIQLNPIGIKIDMPVKEQIKITHSTPIKVYLKGMNKPLGTSHVYSLMTTKGILLCTFNYPVLKKNTVLKESETPVLREWQALVRFNINSGSENILSIPLNAIKKDNKGTYVWKAKGQKVMQTDKGIDYTFPIQKIYIQPGNMIRYQSGFSKVVSLESKGNLELYDLVLNNPPPDLKDGETVIYPQQAYLMMPGDELRVVIGEGQISAKTKAVKLEKLP